MDTSSFLIWNMTLPIVHVECYICLKECKLHCLHFCSRTKGTRRLARKVSKLLPQSPPFSRYGPGGKLIQRSIRKVWETKSPTAIPIGSMGLVYLPTFTIKKSPKCRHIYRHIPYMDPLGQQHLGGGVCSQAWIIYRALIYIYIYFLSASSKLPFVGIFLPQRFLFPSKSPPGAHPPRSKKSWRISSHSHGSEGCDRNVKMLKRTA